MKKINSIFTKAKTVLKTGIEPYEEGIYYYNNPEQEIEDLAKERVSTCVMCPMYIEEPVDICKVKDERIKDASEKMCRDCGCTLSYKIRQTKQICDKWQKK